MPRARELVDQPIVMPVGEVVHVPYAHDRRDRLRLGHLVSGGIRHAEVPDHALLLEFDQGAEPLEVDTEVGSFVQDGERAIAVGWRSYEPGACKLHGTEAELGDGQPAQGSGAAGQRNSGFVSPHAVDLHARPVAAANTDSVHCDARELHFGRAA
nr:hypothetical protein [Actinokineospora terrae]